MEDLDLGAVDRHFSPVRTPPDLAGLESLGGVTQTGGEAVPTNAGVILFGTDRARRRFFPDAVFRAARFLGVSKVHFLDRLDSDASLIDALAEVERFVQRNTRLASRIESLRREDIREYSEIQLRKVLANAAAHSDYSLRGMTIRVAIYDDRLEVDNPGGWPLGVSEEDFKTGISRPRNPAIARVLRKLNIIEQWGTGYRRIEAATETGLYIVPEWRELGQVLRVALYPSTFIHQAATTIHPDKAVSGDIGSDTSLSLGDSSAPIGARRLTQRQTWFVLMLTRGRAVSAADLVKEFGVSERTARRDIAALQRRGVIAFEGSTQTGRYVLLDRPNR